MKQADIDAVERTQMKSDIPEFRVGDSLKVDLRIVEEGGKERIQNFAGICIARKGGGSSETFSLYRVAHGEGMERVFFLHSPCIARIEVVRTGAVRRSKLYYLRNTTGKAAKVKSRFVAKKALPSESSDL